MNGPGGPSCEEIYDAMQRGFGCRTGQECYEKNAVLADLNQNGLINIIDFAILARRCPQVLDFVIAAESDALTSARAAVGEDISEYITSLPKRI